MGLTQNLGRISTGLTTDASLNIGVGVTPSGTYKFEVGTTSKFTGVATFGSTMSNGTYTYTLPSATGTLALTSAIPTNAVGASGFWTSGFLAKINGTYTVTSSIIQDDGGSHVAIGYLTNPALYMLDVNGTGKFVGQLTLGSTITNGTYTYTLPSATGTLALTSALSGYLPLTGGTLTGALGGTSATFSSQLKVSNTTGSALDMLVLETGFDNPSGNKSIIWKDVTNTLGRISVSYDAGTGSTMRFGSLYNGGYQSSDLLTLASTGAATFSSSVTAGGFGAFTAATNGAPVLTLGTSGVINAVINTADEMFFNIDSDNNQTEASFIFATNRTGTSGGTELVRFKDNGNVGIGTTSPDQKLTIQAQGGNGLISFKSSAGSTTSFIGVPNANGDVISTSTTTDLCFRNETGNMLFQTFGGERMRITSGGNVGIGTTAPSGRLNTLALAATENMTLGSATQMGLSITAANGGAYGIHFGVGNSGNSWIQTGRTDGNTSSYNMSLQASGGNVLIGTTTDNTDKLQVLGNITSLGSNASLGFQNRSGTSNTFVWYATSGTAYFYNSAVGNIASINPTTGVYTALSDINKKKDFEISKIGLNEILQLRPTLYRMKDEVNTNKHLGFIAQEVKDIIPQAYTENGDFIGLDYQAITSALVKAIQEQQAQIKELQSQINK